MTHHAGSRSTYFILFFAITLIAMIPGTASWATEPGNECWSSDYYQPGVTGYVYSMTSRPEGVYICGSITGLGPNEARGIALVSEVGGVYEVQAFGDLDRRETAFAGQRVERRQVGVGGRPAY